MQISPTWQDIIKTFPDKKAAIDELIKVHNFGSSVSDITGYYFLDFV